jgi:ubiquinone/menaquinone biosynthesis C-methylase UbiE
VEASQVLTGGIAVANTVHPVAEQTAPGLHRSFLPRQFGHPRGVLGWLAGQLMALQNAPANRLAVELLDVTPGDRILEIGFGPGLAIQMLTSTPAESIAGIDHSATMLRQATRRNREGIRTGRVELREAPASQLPFADARFTKVFGVNSFHHWPTPEAGLLEARRVLREGGLLLLCVRMALPVKRMFAAPGWSEERVQQAVGRLKQAGFRDIRLERRNVGRDVTVFLANK